MWIIISTQKPSPSARAKQLKGRDSFGIIGVYLKALQKGPLGAA